MRAIVLMFDSLNRRFLPSYGADRMDLPNFTRLQSRTITFDSCYAGSMPCMPARREMHTGRYNFLHRSWGPLEPFDDSVPEILGSHGVYTHLVTDHQHYWEDGGATYHNRFQTYEFFRGQEGDRWKGHVEDPEAPASVSWRSDARWRQDWINRQYMPTVEEHSQYQTVQAGLDFIETNRSADNWFLQVECFDPHEPFFSYDEHKRRYRHDYTGDHFDWPDYRRVVEDEATVAHLRAEYAALLSMCDDSLGRVLDAMDRHQLWDDTMLIVCTDHGLLLGERGWWGKNVQPWYDENIHTPLFVWDPRTAHAGERRSSLVQTIDFGPTLLDLFGIEPTEDMQGRSLRSTIARDEPVRAAGLFGSFGGHVCVTDGRFVYMRACADSSNRPLLEHTLMPTHMDGRFTPEELMAAELCPPFSFTKSVPVLRVPGSSIGNPYTFGTLLFDLEKDPSQLVPLNDPELELQMIRLLVEAMRANDAPSSQFERLGLPHHGEPSSNHLQVDRQWSEVVAGVAEPVPAAVFPTGRVGVQMTLRDLDEIVPGLEPIARHLGLALTLSFLDRFGHLSPWQLSVMIPGISESALRALDDELAQRRLLGTPVGTDPVRA